MPLTEESPLRDGLHIDGPAWENLDVEEAYRGAGATVLRLGEHDYRHRFELVLRRAVAWHLRHPPGDADAGFSADDAALAAAR